MIVSVWWRVQFLIACNIPFSLFIMVAIAVDRYLCICHPFTRLVTVFRAKLTVVVLAMCASAVGVCVALTYGVYNQFPLYALIAAASANHTLQPAASAAGYDVTPLSTGDDGSDWDGERVATCAEGNCSDQAGDVESITPGVPSVVSLFSVCCRTRRRSSATD